MGTKTLKQYTVNETIFDEIVKIMKSRIKYTNDLKQYYKGYPEKKTIYYSKGNDGEFLIMQEYLLNYFCKYKIENCSDYKQVIVRKIENQTEVIKGDITGLYAWNFITRLLLKSYKKDELKAIMGSYDVKYDPKKIQFHYFYPCLDNTYIVKHENCVKYDINGAHADALREMFPKAAKDIEEMYLKRKENPNYKAFLNYFVGFMKRKGYVGAYNWIVQRTTGKLMAMMKTIGGQLLYANTDGFMVKNPTKIVESSKELGQFKLEYQGTSYFYGDKNYSCYQINKDGKIDITGNVRMCVRNKIDLEHGKVVHYNLERVQLCEGITSVEVCNVNEEILNENCY